MLVICDQYFVSDLCAVFERMLIERLTIKKAVDMFDFAGDYNRATLRQASLDFMVANIERILEHHCLASASGDVIGQVCDRYLEMLPNSSNHNHKSGRLGKTFPKFGDGLDYDDAWDDAKMENMVKDFDLNLNAPSAVSVSSRRKKERKTSDSQLERLQLEKDAIEAMKAMSLEEDDCRSNASSTSTSSSYTMETDKFSFEILAQAKHWTKVTEKKEPRSKLTLAGLKANEVLAAERKEEDEFVSLNKLSYLSASFDSNSDDCASQADEFFERSPLSLASFSPQKPLKLSQKQRKSLNKIGNSTSPDVRPGSPVSANPWSINTPSSSKVKTPDLETSPSPSFFDVKPGAAPSIFESPRSTRSQPTSPSSMGSSSSDVAASKSMDHFMSIVRKEQREKNYFHKLRNKSLALTLMEERAIDELKKFYNVENTFDERISVERKESLQPTMNFAKWELEK